MSDINSIYADEVILYKHSSLEKPLQASFNPHTHDYCELLLVKKGELAYTVRGKRYILHEDDLIISRPSEIHFVAPVSNSTYDRYNIIYDEKRLPFDIWKKIPHNLDIINLHHLPHILGLFEKMDYYCSELSGVELQTALVSLTNEIYLNLILEVQRSVNKYEYEHTNEIVYNAISYIEKNLSDIINVDEIANALYITKSHLHHVFMQHMGITPKKYITIKRLSFIQRELSLGAKPTEVYEKYGFTDYSTFYRAYKSHYKRSPSSRNSTEPINDITQ